MTVLSKDEITQLLDSEDPCSLFVDPLLERDQVQELTVDLRLGYDFLVSIVTRQPSISLRSVAAGHSRSIASYFQETRRDIGSTFILYPNQVVLATTLEYVALPPDLYADVFSRSSITRLGVPLSTMVQPGFRGCIPLELFNHGNNAIELVVGARVCQMRLNKISVATNYAGRPRKYFGDVRPKVSRADTDKELKILGVIGGNGR